MPRRPRPGSVRNVVTGRSDGYTGRIPFPRLEWTTVAYESLLARDFLVQTAAFEHDVAAVVSEPARLEVQHEGFTFRYDTDYRVDRIAGPSEYVEVKSIEEVDPSRARLFSGEPWEAERACADATARFRSIEAAVRAQGLIFRLVTEDEIRVEPRLGNAALVLRHAGDLFPAPWLLAAREALATRDIACVGDLQTALPSLDAFVIALRLQWEGDLDIDPMRPFTRASSFSRIGRSPRALPVPTTGASR